MGQTAAPAWRPIGTPSVDLALAGPATGPVEEVWFSADGAVLYTRTASGRVFQTSDFENWALTTTAPAPPSSAFPGTVARRPESNARVVTVNGDLRQVYALGRNLYRSQDMGTSWQNLTAFRTHSVVGSDQRSVAYTYINQNQLVVGNDYGVWRTMDGGLSWTGLNQFLPNLSIRRILATPSSAGGARVVDANLAVLELAPGGSVWHPVDTVEPEFALRQQYSNALGAEITAVGNTPDGTVYAGSSDGRIWVSMKGGAFSVTRQAGQGRVERIFVDSESPNIALAALSGSGPHVLRTTNYGAGGFWDSLDGNLPNAPAHGVTAEWSSGAVYVASDKGVFWTHADLQNNASPEGIKWTRLTDRLPDVAAMDVRLDPAGVQVYAALDGYGLFATAAPHRLSNLRLVNTADFSTRAAAPGSLLSVIGGPVSSARGGDLDYPVVGGLGNESQIQVPFEAVGPRVNLALQTGTGVVRRDLPVQPVSPAILVGKDGTPMLWDADSGLALDTRNPAHSNGRVQIWADGLGRVTPDWHAGQRAPLENPPAVVANVRVLLDGNPLQVTRATLLPGYTGFYLVEVQLPSINNLGQSELRLNVDGQDSNRVQIVIEP